MTDAQVMKKHKQDTDQHMGEKWQMPKVEDRGGFAEGGYSSRTMGR